MIRSWSSRPRGPRRSAASSCACWAFRACVILPCLGRAEDRAAKLCGDASRLGKGGFEAGSELVWVSEVVPRPPHHGISLGT